jgi:hypothetical protein
MAAAWSGLSSRAIYRLVRTGRIPSIATGAPQIQDLPAARNGTRPRSCFRFIIPRVAFIKWFESIESSTIIGEPAASPGATAA